MNTARSPSRLGVQSSIILVIVVGIAYAGARTLAVPPVFHPTKVMSWWASAGPVAGAMFFFWSSIVVAGSYWLVLYTVAMVASARGRTEWLRRMRLPGTNHLLRSIAGASVLGVALAAASGCGSARSPVRAGGDHHPTPPVLVPLGSAPTAPTTTAPTTTAPTTTAPTTTLPAQPPPESVGDTSPAAPDQPPAASALPGAGTTWTVKPGDDLWSIAESVLAGRLGRRPTSSEVAPLWLRVIDANRATLPDPGNPNLIFAGDVVAVPW